MLRAAESALRGLKMHQTYIDVTGNNIANVNTDGFKRSQAEFEDILTALTKVRGMPDPGTPGTLNPAMVGLGVRLHAIDGQFSQGALKITNVATDLAIQGEGYFVLQGPTGPVYTRSGTFTLDANGTVRAGDGKALLSTTGQPISVQGSGVTGAPAVSISPNGQVIASNGTQQAILGTIQLARFTNQSGLERVGNTEFRITVASGPAITGQGNTNGLGQIISGVVETSNVDMGTELTNLIVAQRGFSANQKVMTATDELVDQLNKLR
ncbi:MAG TPA: flagellar biosynthesis protein FlgE [Actinobacteria bacterium]|nr:flagellar biosynthesis protein FlgE [Actinomycetota bacterium]